MNGDGSLFMSLFIANPLFEDNFPFKHARLSWNRQVIITFIVLHKFVQVLYL